MSYAVEKQRDIGDEYIEVYLSEFFPNHLDTRVTECFIHKLRGEPHWIIPLRDCNLHLYYYYVPDVKDVIESIFNFKLATIPLNFEENMKHFERRSKLRTLDE